MEQQFSSNQHLFAVGLWQSRAKATKKHSGALQLYIMAAQNSWMDYGISKCRQVPVVTVQSIIQRCKTFYIVENLRGHGKQTRVTPTLSSLMLREVKKYQGVSSCGSRMLWRCFTTRDREPNQSAVIFLLWAATFFIACKKSCREGLCTEENTSGSFHA